MGILIVNCTNRPQDEVIDCGVYGLRMNMLSHNVEVFDGEVVVGTPLNKGQKLPLSSDKDEKILARIESVRSNIAGAILGTETSGILSTDLPGGVEPPKLPVESSSVSIPKPAQVKEGGE